VQRAATATIAKEAGVSNGSLFTYFETKADLLNQLYIELKAEMAAAALDGLPTESDIRKQVLHMWSHWLRWAMSCPEKRRTLAHLGVSDDITSESRQAAQQTRLASPSCWSGAVKTDRCAMRRWGSSLP
jgi:AcrR family transcriptional regulator